MTNETRVPRSEDGPLGWEGRLRAFGGRRVGRLRVKSDQPHSP